MLETDIKTMNTMMMNMKMIDTTTMNTMMMNMKVEAIEEEAMVEGIIEEEMTDTEEKAQNITVGTITIGMTTNMTTMKNNFFASKTSLTTWG